MGKPREGDRAPDFELPWTGEGELRLDELRGQWVILAFYPGDFTAVCTNQLCHYRDGRERLETLDAEVIGISPQDLDSHERFIAKHGLTVPLAADGGKRVARAYGVLGPGGFVRRSIFIVDPEGIIRHASVARLGLSYLGVDELAEALSQARGGAGVGGDSR